jgi:hypothetical protein
MDLAKFCSGVQWLSKNKVHTSNLNRGIALTAFLKGPHNQTTPIIYSTSFGNSYIN